ncbi:MAG: diaminopimelate decarboxylase family protein [Candidatus Hermodarchaeota archaeon]
MTEWIDDCLSIRDGHLYMEECDTTELVKKFGSPIFVYSENQLRRNVRRYQQAFEQYWTDGPVEILPASKANWISAVRAILTQEGTGADIYSEGELGRSLKSKVPPHMISVNGGGKSDDMLRKCIEADVRITVEDLDEPERINRIAKELGKVAKIRLRVKPDFSNLWKKSDFSLESASIDIDIQVYKSGIPAQYLEELGKQVLQMKNVELTGIHFHGGRHHKGLWFWRGLMKKYGLLIARLCKVWGGYQPKEIDIGGGFAASRDPFNKLGLRGDVILTYFSYPFELLLMAIHGRVHYKFMSKLIEKIMVKMPSSKRAPTIEAYAEAASTVLKKTLNKKGVDTNDITLQVEPGRSLFSDMGIHLARVKKFKQQTKPIKMNWVLTDTTYFFLSGGVYEYTFHGFRIANKADQPGKHVADVVGHSCYADRILPFVKVPDMEEEDIIAFLDMGAYQEVSASNFNAFPRPAVVLVNGEEAEIIKKAETIEDVYRRDIIPERLEKIT